jgi:tRNA-2-methylthio-N6-dimethylallyladenosine synthase
LAIFKDGQYFYKKDGEKMKYHIKTFGCQMNVNETEIMSGILEKEGWQWTENPSESDFIIINTCSVREKAENKMYSAIGNYAKIKKRNKNLKLAVCGCSAEKEKEKILSRFNEVDFVFGTRNIVDISNLYKKSLIEKKFVDFTDKLELMSYQTTKKPFSNHHAWITIIHGCNKYCTYCIVPYTRGLEKSRNFDDLIKEAESYAEKGFKEITLLGQNVDSYGKDFGDGKPKLDKLIDNISKIEGIERIWFTTSYPTDITDELIETVAKNEKAAKFFHLPVQSGSNKILKEMNRKYTREYFLDLVKKIKEKIPDVTITTDLILGFPSETDLDFEDTLDLVKKCRFEKINVAEYSPREGTIAYKYKRDDIPKEMKNKRLQKILDTQKEINREENEKYLNKILEVVQESKVKSGEYLGRTSNNKVVIFPAEEKNLGKKVNIEIHRISAGPLYGIIV